MKHIEIEVKKLLKEMNDKIEKEWDEKIFVWNLRWNPKHPMYHSKIANEFRIKSLQMIRNEFNLWTTQERQFFINKFWRLTNKRFFCKNW